MKIETHGRSDERASHSCRPNDQPPETFELRHDPRTRRLDQNRYIPLHHGALIIPPTRHRRRHIQHSQHLLLLGQLHERSLLQVACRGRHNHRFPHPHLSHMVRGAMPLLRDGVLLRLLLVLQSVLPFTETEERGVPATATALQRTVPARAADDVWRCWGGVCVSRTADCDV